MNGRSIADAIALAAGGSVRDVPTGDGRVQLFVALADGRVPVLVRDWGHTIGVCVTGSQAWTKAPNEFDAALVRHIGQTVVTWAESRPTDAASIFDVALDVAAHLSEALGEAWTVGIPSPPEPREIWLYGVESDAASVGVFDGRVLVWLDGRARDFPVASRGELDRGRSAIVEAVREQIRRFHRNVETSERIRLLADELAAKLGERLAKRSSVSILNRPSHSSAISATVACGDFVRIRAEHGVIRIHAGLVGPDGWEAEFSSLDQQFEPIVDAVGRARRTLTIERLVVGNRYRVLESLDELQQGAVVRFVGFDDIDNHYGRYEFTTESGQVVAVSGDFSTPRNSRLGEVHRYLSPIPDT